MARLNEPLAAPDCIETLRRRFLRQNRDIARTNSTQSLRIRSLENECARMLSENLELRGQILRLETELRESRAQRIADHALEIKEKMEAQLLEWGSMLASLGHEPIPKNRSPRAAKKMRMSPGMGLASSPRLRRRNTSELEAAALQEGRLAPLWENKSCPRETLNQEEILALCSEAVDTTDSPDLGPPPVSRFVDEDPVKIGLPTKSSSEAERVEESLSKPLVREAKEPTPENEPAEEEPQKIESSFQKPVSRPVVLLPAPEPEVAKANLKRKTREDEERDAALEMRPRGDPTKLVKGGKENLPFALDRPASRPIKHLPLARKDAREKPIAAKPSAAPRKPLGAKSANEVVNSPKKSAKGSILDEIAKAKAEFKGSERTKERAKPKMKEAPTPVEIPAPEPEPVQVASVDIAPDALSAEPDLAMPDSPQPAAPREEMRDTPPPADISAKGETSRGSRRAKAAVSYAEPNLRDKMRRPTKQLFDAVAGEGKSMRRTSHSKSIDLPSVKSEEKSQGWKDLPAASGSAASEMAASPLVRKVSRTSPSDLLPTTDLTDRRKRDSVQGGASDNSAPATGKVSNKPMNRRLEEIATREAEVAKIFDGEDVYEFTSSSPKSNGSQASTPEKTRKTSSSRAGKSRRLSSIMREELAAEAASTGPHEKSKNPRKRASMTVQKTTSRFDSEDGPAEGDSSFNSTSSGDMDAAVKDKVAMRRRSMML
ncbi:hypothetical protein JX266_000162 [Neoarthrinium moseri]|nr:hypothetical protein JX266_000162 [Neoarthrinium moseri]